MHLSEFNWDTKPIGISDESTEEQAQVAAINLVKSYLKELLNNLTED